MVVEGLTFVDEGAFYWCWSLISVDVPSTLTHIGKYVFSRNSLPSITLPEGVVSIGDHAFDNPGYTTVFLVRDSVRVS